MTEALVNPDTIDESVTSLRTLLIAKTKQPGPGDFRPISIMNNVMNLVSKMILQTIKSILLDARLISEVQGAFGVNSIGSKELVLLDEVITGQHKGNLNVAWLDVKKASDSIPHNYVRSILRNLPIPHGAVNIIERLYQTPSTRLELLGNKTITPLGTIPLKKGILQGDSLSPLLFVLVMQPFTLRLENSFPKLEIGESSKIEVNHLLFMDDLKLLAEDKETLSDLLKATGEFFSLIGLELNAKKSARTEAYGEVSSELKKIPITNTRERYKCLGVLQCRRTCNMSTKRN